MRLTKQQKAKNGYLKRVYGITLLEYGKILALQKMGCAICGRPPTSKALSVDHKHQRGDAKRGGKEKRPFVRGLLCWMCNTAIGKFRDNSTKMRAAADYIDNPPAKKVIT